MRITCPSCAAEYEVPTPRLSSDKKVRCARCGAEWRIVREPVAALREPAETPEPGHRPEHPVATATRVEPPEAGHAGVALRAAWVVSALVLIVVVAAVITWRTDIIHAWPPGARLLGPFGRNETALSQKTEEPGK